MGKHRTRLSVVGAPQGDQGGLDGRLGRARWSLQIFAFLASIALVMATIVDPSAAAAERARASVAIVASGPVDSDQSVNIVESEAIAADHKYFTTSRIRAAAPAAGFPDPGTAKAIGYEMVMARGWDVAQYNCLAALWDRESHWNVYSANSKSGAYGIPQALPGTKMASVAADWETNPATQITWGLGYIAARYGDPCGAWTSSQTRGWY